MVRPPAISGQCARGGALGRRVCVCDPQPATSMQCVLSIVSHGPWPLATPSVHGTGPGTSRRGGAPAPVPARLGGWSAGSTVSSSPPAKTLNHQTQFYQSAAMKGAKAHATHKPSTPEKSCRKTDLTAPVSTTKCLQKFTQMLTCMFPDWLHVKRVRIYIVLARVIPFRCIRSWSPPSSSPWNFSVL